MIYGKHNLHAAAFSFWFLSVSQVLSQSQSNLVRNRTSLRNISLYPACVHDSDCGGGHACFQYMCYPWNTSTGFRWCSKDADCSSLTVREEGDGGDGRCFRHHDKDNITFGICLKKIETKKCWTHSDCLPHLRCTNGFCGDSVYFKALQDRPCEEDELCERLLTGEMCCFDLSAADQWKSGQSGWKKRCCNNPSGSPVIRPDTDISHNQIKKLDKAISSYLAPYFLDFVVCEGLSYQMMLRLSSCLPYTTTTTTTDRTNQLHHTASADYVAMDSGVLLVVTGYMWYTLYAK